MGESGARRAAPEGYFKSREVYRSERGCILVDAFRFVEHFSCSLASSRSPPLSSEASPSPQAKTQALNSENARSRWQREPYKFYFLSHFHSDHYTGIQRSWHTDMIYCSRPTAALTQSELGVSSACLFPMDMNETYVFSLQTGVCLACVRETPLHPRVQAMLRNSLSPTSSATAAAAAAPAPAARVEQEDVFAVRLISANHCPGAAIFLFVSPLFGTVVHTGDFRFNGSMRHWREGIRAPSRRTYVSIPQIQLQARVSASSVITDIPPPPPYEQFIEDDAALLEVAKQEALDTLFLDNTFCGPPYTFPTQWEATQMVVEATRSLFCRTARRKKEAAEPPSTPPPPRTCVRCAVLVGCYTIGKERVALALRDAFPRVSSPPSSSAENSEDVERNNWRIYVSPRRFAMLTAMDFFPHCFQPLQPAAGSRSEEGAERAVLGNSTDNDPCVPYAEVEDTAVHLPVLLHSERAQHIWEGAQVRSAGCASGGADAKEMLRRASYTAAPVPEVRRSLAADFSTQLSDAPGSPISGESQGDETQYLLSVFLVSMANVGYQSVAALARNGSSAAVLLEGKLKLDLAPYDCILVVEPTGWCKRCSTRDINDKVTLLKVPYSEHCGFPEMVRFVQFVNPQRVVPTVSEDSFKNCEALFLEKAPRLRSRAPNVQRITHYFSPVPMHSIAGVNKTKRETTEDSADDRPRSAVATNVSCHSHATATLAMKVPSARSSPPVYSAVVTKATSEANGAASAVIISSQPSDYFSLDENQAEPKASLPLGEKEESQKAVIHLKALENGKRKRPQQGEEGRSAEALKMSSTAQTLDRLFQRIKVDAARRGIQTELSVAMKTSPSHRRNDKNSGKEDEDCQVVRVAQPVVEISDDD
ncbi:hypothetical protein ABL78_6065 [Leptomonas seymouri]|uniref:Protein artemis n=1 Tax=Leptomonas seymouri TaxID=5684 RepID=A0A0N1PB91_LEPSE|nr:hypothetical protein ABL78_6065 [Leptomonas seymouri]|eukprot:KPI84883.1 hypothetical protein ABL78_6065 [Leptomonas seymouri]